MITLISAGTFHEAQREAHRLQLGAFTWEYIPVEPILLRSSKLMGKHGYTPDRLVGPFTDFEIAYLTTPRVKRL